MLPTFVIGLREGLEAALIVGIIAAFLRKQGRKDLLAWVMGGVGIAIVLCLGAGIALRAYSQGLPQKQQEGLETIIGVLAVCMVTYMVIWMRRNSRNLKGQLEGLAADAMHGGHSAARAMVLMAFLAVIREGLETVVFLLAAFNESANTTTTGLGAVIGIAVAMVLGYGIYRGGVRLNLSKFFRATGLVLVLVAAGLVVNALHTAHEAGWLNAGQGSTVDLTGLVRPGTVQSSLLTGMLGVQQHPVVIEVLGWLVYLIPVGLYVAWPPGRGLSLRVWRRMLLGAAGVLALAAVVLALVAPGLPSNRPATPTGTSDARLVSSGPGSVLVRTAVVSPLGKPQTGPLRELRLKRAGQGVRHGVQVQKFVGDARGTGAQGRPTTVSLAALAALNSNRLPIGLHVTGGSGTAALTYIDTDALTVWLNPQTGRIVELTWAEQVTATVKSGIGQLPLGQPVATATRGLGADATSAAYSAARADLDQRQQHANLVDAARWCAVLAILALIGASTLILRSRTRDGGDATPVSTPTVALVKS